MRVRQDMGETRHAADVIDVVATLAHRPGQVNLRAKAGGEVLGVVTLHPDNAEKVYNFAKRVGVDYSQIERAITTLQAAVQVGLTGNTRPDPDCPPFQVTLRGMTQPQAEGRLISGETPLLALRNALDVADYPYAEPVVEWGNTALLAALDVDFHDRPLEQRPTAERLRALAEQVRPGPALWWPTHGRGLRLVYTPLGGLQAAELSACAALGVRSIEPGAGIEIVSHTRHPLYPRPDYPPAGPVQASSPTADLGVLARWLARDVDDRLVAEWLAERGLEQGGRYEHSRCPADADTPSHGQPVFVGHSGICCHKCQAAGVTLGSRRPGFFPWPALVGGGVSTRLRSAARNFVHWDHAKFLLADDLRLEGGLARLCYSAVLKTLHGTADPRVEEAMRRGTGLVRMDGYWVTGDLTRTHRDAGLVDRLAKLPAVCDLVPGEVNKPSRIVTNRERLGIFQGVDDLGPYGYARVQPVRGMKIFGQWLDSPDPGAVTAVVPPERLRADEMAPFRPRYVPASQRMSISEAEGILEKSFPGINFDYLRLVIAARGCAEGGVGQPPRIAVDGPSGAGKDNTVAIAAALIGDACRDVPWVPDIGQFHTALNEAGQSAGLATSSEIVKHIKAKKGDVLTSLSPLLTFQRGLTVRKYYVGPISVRQVPVVVITDIAFPREMHADEQLGRRFVHVHLERKVDWQGPARMGIEGWRAAGQGHADAANAIVSQVIDGFFAGETPPVFEEIAQRLGFSLLNQGGDLGLNPQAELHALFDGCCHELAVLVQNSKWRGRGWCQVSRDGQDPVSVAWREVCDNLGEGFVSSRRVKEADWASLLGADQAVECDISPNGGSTLAIRFRSGKSRSPELKVNSEIPRASRPPEPPVDPPSPPPDRPPGGDGDEPPTRPPQPAPAPVSTHSAKDGAVPPAGFGLPVFIDLETRSACDLRVEGGRRYAAHPTTEILTVSAMIDRHVILWTPTLPQPLSPESLWPEGFGPTLPIATFTGPNLPGPLREAIEAGRPLCAHKASEFDALVWRAKGLSEPAAWIDSLVEARAAGWPGALDKLASRLFGRGKQKDGAELIRRYCCPDKSGEFRPFGPEAAAGMARYNIADVLLLARVYNVVGGHAEPDVVALDAVINGRGISFDAELARALLRQEEQEAQAAGEEVERLTAGAVKPTDLRRVKKLREWLGSRGVEVADLQKGTLEGVLRAKGDLEAAARRVIEARLAAGRVATGKLERALATCLPDGRLRDHLAYHGCHTGRWSGRGVQLQNLPRPHDALKDLPALLGATHDLALFKGALPAGVSVADALSSLVRLCFRAEPGKLLLIADWAAIEARGVAWCADERRLLDLFAAGRDTYCDFAGGLFGREVTKAMKRERAVGKQAVLACGYGMGPDTFAQRCEDSGVDLAAAGVTAAGVVEGYRDAYPAITGTRVDQGAFSRREGGLWQSVEDAAFAAVGRGVHGSAGRCEFFREQDALVIRLPSGRRFYYRSARIEERVPGYCRTQNLPDRPKPTLVYDGPDKTGIVTYGAKLVENIVQAVCRDLLVAALRECERQSLPVVLHVHDEVVVEVPATGGKDALRRLVTIMSTPPAWAEGFPIEVEGFVSERYLKSPPEGAVVVSARNGQLLEKP